MPSTPSFIVGSKNTFLLCQTIGWLLYIVFIYLAYGVDSSHSPAKVLLYYACEMLFGFALTCILKHPLQKALQCSPPWLILISTSLVVMTAYSWTLLKVAVFHRLFDLLAHQTLLQTTQEWLPNSLSTIAAWCAIYFAFHFGKANAAQEKTLLKLESQANESKLKMLRYQLNPHFLFNTLASIRALVGEDKAKARKMILELSDLLRYSLYSDPLALHPLRDELEVLQSYINIERIRYQDKFVLETNISNESQSVPIPSMLLQPLFENIVKHSLALSIEPIRITLQAKREETRLCLFIENTLAEKALLEKTLVENTLSSPKLTPQAPSEQGIGQRNTLARLTSLYGQSFRFEAGIKHQHDKKVYRVEIEIPINKVQGEDNDFESDYCR